MTGVRQAILARMAETIARPLVPWVNPDTWLLTPVWVETFTTLLQVHHGYSTDPMTGSAFENAFVAACRSTGWSVIHNESLTQRFIDATLTHPDRPDEPALRLSLKTTAAKGMSRKTIHISKLTEAAWIQDLRLAKSRQPKIVGLFRAYREATDLIFILRGFRHEERIEYELTEIPTAMFAQLDDLPKKAFEPNTIAAPFGVTPPDFKVRVDKSDAKITLTGVNIQRCLVHATWTVPTEVALAV